MRSTTPSTSASPRTTYTASVMAFFDRHQRGQDARRRGRERAQNVRVGDVTSMVDDGTRTARSWCVRTPWLFPIIAVAVAVAVAPGALHAEDCDSVPVWRDGRRDASVFSDAGLDARLAPRDRHFELFGIAPSLGGIRSGRGASRSPARRDRHDVRGRQDRRDSGGRRRGQAPRHRVVRRRAAFVRALRAPPATSITASPAGDTTAPPP